MAPSHGGIQQTAPGTKHHPASPQRRSVLRRCALQSFTRHPPPTPWETECFPSPLVWEPSIDQPISSATRITRALHPHLQCPCWVSSSPAAVSAHMPSSLTGPSSPQVPGVEPSSLLGPLPSPSMGPTCCLSLHSGTLPSSGMAQPVSGVPGEKVITDPVPFPRLPPTGRIWDENIIMPHTRCTLCASHFVSVLQALTYSTLATTLHEGTIIVIPILQRKKLRPRKVK